MTIKYYELDEILPIYDFEKRKFIASKDVDFSDMETDFWEDGINYPNVTKEEFRSYIYRYREIVNKLKEKYNYKCQMCGYTFKMKNGKGYCEAHHLVPLALSGSQDKENVIILCANHHRMLHYGKGKVNLGPKEKGSRKLWIEDEEYLIKY